jgi:hydroxymethylglutaryl-CoA lyase
MSDLPSFVRINEEGPREGFQIEGGGIPTDRKVQLIDRLSATGLKQIQVASFVNPKRVPGMADAEQVVARFKRYPDVRYTALWLNEQGFGRALATGRLDLVGRIVLCASPAFLKRNQNMTPEENVNSHRRQVVAYLEKGVPVTHGGLQATFGCNFEGDISIQQVLATAADVFRLAAEFDLKLKTFTLADTMAWANPTAVHRTVVAFRQKYPDVDVILHLHDTRGLGVANALAGLQAGVTSFDTAVGGLGGCPFAAHRGAAGNLCTEDFVFMCHEMGVDTGIDLDALIETARLAQEIVGHPLPGSVMQGGNLKGLRQSANAAKSKAGAMA